MELSFKDIRFTIEAIDLLTGTYAIRLDRQDIDEDEAADLGNDQTFLQSLRHKLSTNVESNLVNKPSLTLRSQTIPAQTLINLAVELPIDRRLALIDAITESIRQELRSVG